LEIRHERNKMDRQERFRLDGDRRDAALLLCVTGLTCLVARAREADEDRDPPTRVARISYLDGAVSMQLAEKANGAARPKNAQ